MTAATTTPVPVWAAHEAVLGAVQGLLGVCLMVLLGLTMLGKRKMLSPAWQHGSGMRSGCMGAAWE